MEAFQFRHHPQTAEVVRLVEVTDRLLDLEMTLARQMMGEKKAAIIADGLMALKQQHLEGK